MASFESTKGMTVQRQFEVLEIDLPVITGACTVGVADGFGTPLTCDQTWTGEYKTYYFTNSDTLVLPSIGGQPIWRVIESISETPTELKPGNGLSSRGSLSVSMKDFTDQDPNEGAPGVTNIVKNQGTFFGKLAARQVFENKDVRLNLYRVQPDGSVDLINGAQTRRYVSNAFKLNVSTGKWTLECKDVLSIANLNEKTWPIPTDSFLRQDITDIATSIPVDGDTDYSNAFAVRVGDEFMEILSVADNLTPTATLNVNTRGSTIYAPTSGVLLTRTSNDEHSAGDEVFICDLSDDETIDSLIAKVLVDSDLDPVYIPYADWAAEVEEWHANDKINTLHSESESVNDVLNRILTGFLMDLWFNVIDSEVKLSAISVWKESTATLTEGKEINSYSIKKTPQDSIRASRALVIYDKKDLALDDDTSNYKKASQFSDPALISDAFFGKHKDKLFKNNFLLSEDAANLLTQRYVSRFKFTPFVRSWETEEKNLNFKTGDVVDVISTSDQSASGAASGNIRSQILKIKPKYGKSGRTYDVSAMTYEAAFNADDTEIILNTPLSEVNLYILAGAPSQVVTITFILDGTYSQGDVSIRGGNFVSGSKIILILANGFDGQASGGSGSGANGGVVYDANGVDTDVYFSGATPSTAYPTADGYIRAPGGGGAIGARYVEAGTEPVIYGGGGGGGGAGRPAGIGDPGSQFDFPGEDGSNGDIIGGFGIGGAGNGLATDGGDGGGWGVTGGDSLPSPTDPGNDGGDAGSGIIDSGATVTLFGDTPTRYINGNGDH